MMTDDSVQEVAAQITRWFSDLFDDLVQLADESAAAMATARGRLSSRDLKAIEPAAGRFLDKHPEHEAAGIILRPGIIGAQGEIEWWNREADGRLRTLPFTLTPNTAGFYDFETLEWFSNVITTGRPTLTGPYVDYAGMDKYIITTTVPLRDGTAAGGPAGAGDIIGAAGCDIEMRALEPALMPLLRRIDADAALVSQHDRIVLGNSGRFLVGNRVTSPPAQAHIVELPVHELGLRLIAAPAENR